MNEARWRELCEVFEAALARDEAARGAYLDEACANDAELRTEVDALLAAHRDAGQFGEAPVFAIARDDAAADESPSAESDADADSPPPNASRARHPFLLWVAIGGVITAVVFSHAAWLIVERGDTTTEVGWTEQFESGAWRIGSVDPSGPAAGALEVGDRILALDGIAPLLQIETGTQVPRRRIAPNTSYQLEIERDGARQSHTLTGLPGPSARSIELSYFAVSLVWCLVGLWIGASRPDEWVARIGALSASSVGWVFVQVGVIQGGPLWEPLHMVLGYHFYTRFPSGRAPSRVWRVALWAMYAIGALPAVAGLWMHFTLSTAGPAALAELLNRFPAFFALRYPLGILAFSLAALAMLALIPIGYRRLVDEDQRRRVRWLLFGSFVGLFPMLWWSGVTVYELVLGVPGVSRASAFVNAFTVAIPISAAYAVVVHRAFDISVVIRRGLQYLLARRVLQTGVAVPVAVLAYTLVVDRHRTIAELAAQGSGYLFWIGAGTLALLFRRRIQLWLDRKFFREEFDREQMLLGLVDDLGHVDSISQLSALVCAKLEFALHPTVVHLWYRDPQEHAAASASNPELMPPDFPADERWLAWLERDGSVTELPLPATIAGSRQASRWLQARGVSLIVPMADNAERLAGLLLLGAKKSEEPYTAMDRRLLQAIAKQAAVVRENLQLRAQVSEEQRIRRDVLAHLDGTRELLKECPVCGACFDAPAEHCERDGHALTLSLPVARTIDGKYRLERRIGRGGMGAVYEARDLRLDRSVAVKILLGRGFGEPTALRRLHREARATAQLSHPHIVAVHDYGPLEGEGAFIVMELVPGGTLRAELERTRTLSAAEAADWFDPILSGLAAAHALGIVHRDLKPENVIGWRDVSGALRVKVLDFGLAKLAASDAQANASMTARGVVMGTFGYMSPEQVTGGEVDARTDLFAVGVMLAEALTGRRPFQGETAQDVARAVLHDEYRLPFASAPARALDALLQRCLAKDAPRRLASAAELRAELVRLLRACPAPLE